MLVIDHRPFVSFVVPAFGAASTLPSTIASIRAAAEIACPNGHEIVVIDDGSFDDTPALAASLADVVVVRPCQGGAARARNDAVRVSKGEIILFVDSDVTVTPHAVDGLIGHLAGGADAAIGSYTPLPPEGARNAPTDYKNLLHHFTHQCAGGEARTFWSGFGGVRRDAFDAVTGFTPEATRSADVEDIELGYRLATAGKRIVLDPTLQVSHHKRYDVPGLIRSDVQHRAIPWMRTMLEHRIFSTGLNVSSAAMVASVLAWVAVLGLLVLPFVPLIGGGAVLAGLAGWTMLNRSFLAYARRFLSRRGWWAAYGLHLLASLYSPPGALLGVGVWSLRRGYSSYRNSLPEGLADTARLPLDVTVAIVADSAAAAEARLRALPAREPWWEAVVVTPEPPHSLDPADRWVLGPAGTPHESRLQLALDHARGELIATLGAYVLPNDAWLHALRRTARERRDVAVAGPIEINAHRPVRRGSEVARWWSIRPTRRAGWGFDHSPGNIAYRTAVARRLGGFVPSGQLVAKLSGFGANPIRFVPELVVRPDPDARRLTMVGLVRVGRLQASCTVRYFRNGSLLRAARTAAVVPGTVREVWRTAAEAVRERRAGPSFWLAFPIAAWGIVLRRLGTAAGFVWPIAVDIPRIAVPVGANDVKIVVAAPPVTMADTSARGRGERRARDLEPLGDRVGERSNR